MHKDKFGTEINVGDIVVHCSRSWDSYTQNIGIVTDVSGKTIKYKRQEHWGNGITDSVIKNLGMTVVVGRQEKFINNGLGCVIGQFPDIVKSIAIELEK